MTGRAAPAQARQLLALAGFTGLCLAVGITAGFATASSVTTWYQALAKPPWTPPDWLFAPAWTVLYMLMGVAAWRVWRTGGGWSGRARKPLLLFLLQLALNFAWSFLFFAARSASLGLADIAALWLAIAATIAAFARLDRTSAWLMVPYLAWVTYAGSLNAAIWWLN